VSSDDTEVAPSGVESGGTIVSTVDEAEEISAFAEKLVIKEKRPWRPPNYSGQEAALGWRPDLFSVPEGLKKRVQFWQDIYTRYSTDQGLLHDSLHVGVIYEAIDFRPIMRDQKLNERQKRQARKKLVEDRKKEIRDRLNKLATVTQPETLTGEDLRLWNLFAAFDEPNKFKAATHKRRLRFQLGQSDRFLQGIYFSGRYLEDMEQTFRDRGLPIELTRLVFVESSFNVKARSRVGASGIWQFMRYTGRSFMRINNNVDERNEPFRATEAAARLFTINYNMLGKWPLAITGYNHGPAGVQRVVKKFNTDNIVELVDERHGRFGFASANFYACFLAALHVEQNARQFFGEQAVWDVPHDTQKILLDRNLNHTRVLSWFDGNLELAKHVNSHIQGGFWRGYSMLVPKDFVRVPKAKHELALQELKNSQLPQKMQPIAATTGYYVIDRGDTLSSIAGQLGVSIQILKDLNDIDDPRRIRAGQKLRVPQSEAKD